MKKLFLMLLMVGAAFAANAQSTRQIRGAVVDKKNGNPLPGAKVEATGGAESTVTDADGTFTLEVSQWLKSLTATYPGMNKKKEEIDGTNILFELTPKQKLTWFVNLVGNVSYYPADRNYNTDGCLPGIGLMVGQLGKWGWYGKFTCDFHGPKTFERYNYRLDEGGHSDGSIYWYEEYNSISNYYYYSYTSSNNEPKPLYYDEEEKYIKPGPTITVGGIKSIVPNLFYGFLGFGYTTAYGESEEFTASFVDSSGKRHSGTYRDYYSDALPTTGPGLAAEAGFIFRVSHVNIMLGYTPRFYLDDDVVTHTFNLGVGYVF